MERAGRGGGDTFAHRGNGQQFPAALFAGMFGSARKFQDFLRDRGFEKITSVFTAYPDRSKLRTIHDRKTHDRIFTDCEQAVRMCEGLQVENFIVMPAHTYWQTEPVTDEKLQAMADLWNRVGKMTAEHGNAQDPLFHRPRFGRLLRQAHDAGIVDLAKNEHGFEMTLRAEAMAAIGEALTKVVLAGMGSRMTMVVEFTYTNRDERRDWKCKYVVTIPGGGGETWADNDRTATLDKDDLVFFQNASMTDASSIGSMTMPPPRPPASGSVRLPFPSART